MSGGKLRPATLSLALVGLLLLGLLTAPASAKADAHVMSVDGDAPSGGDEGRVVYADMKLSSSDAPVPAPAPGPSASDE